MEEAWGVLGLGVAGDEGRKLLSEGALCRGREDRACSLDIISWSRMRRSLEVESASERKGQFEADKMDEKEGSGKEVVSWKTEYISSTRSRLIQRTISPKNARTRSSGLKRRRFITVNAAGHRLSAN